MDSLATAQTQELIEELMKRCNMGLIAVSMPDEGDSDATHIYFRGPSAALAGVARSLANKFQRDLDEALFDDDAEPA
jgi:hypothetical protein